MNQILVFLGGSLVGGSIVHALYAQNFEVSCLGLGVAAILYAHSRIGAQRP